MSDNNGSTIANTGSDTISVVVPARNEEATIAAVVERSFAAFDALGREGEVLVVNDGSTDRTAAILAELCARYPRLRVFTHRRSRGMTAGLQTMFSASVGDIVILIPADMESDPLVDVPTLVNYLDAEDLDVAAGWRQERKDSKVLASRVYNSVMTAIGGVQGARRQLDQGHAPRGSRQLPAPAQRLAPLPAHDRRPQRLPHRRDAHLLPAPPGGQQQVRLGAHPQKLPRRPRAQVPAHLQRSPHALLRRPRPPRARLSAS